MLSEIVGVVEVDKAFLVSLYYILGKKDSLGQILADFARHIVTLNRVYGRVLIGVFLLNLFVIALDKRQYLVVGGI